MLVIDAMHCVLEGIVQYHCRHILRVDATVAKGKEAHIAFEYNWTPYDASKITPQTSEADVLSEREEEQVPKIQSKLVEAIVPADSDLPGTNEETLRKALLRFNVRSLRFVAKSLRCEVDETTKSPRRTQPLVDPDFVPKAVDLTGLKFIQRVISKTTTPSWINSVPHNYGENNAGTIKADEWRTLATIYIPIAIVLLWGDQPKNDAERLREMLVHSMALFQAVTLVCRYTSSQDRATAYRLFLKQWVDGMSSNHPHTDEHNARINIHAAFHIYDFILLFGPIMAWWTFPFERLIGTLQKINTNDHIGGELEGTIVRSFWRGANLRRHLNHPDCPEVIKQLKVLFDRTFSPHLDRSAESVPKENGKDRAHYTHQGVNYSRASTHLGNSLVLYHPSEASAAQSPIAGSIQRIETDGHETFFHIQRQAPLPPDGFDPFLPFPHFPAKTYSSLMENTIDRVPPTAVLSHCARMEFSDERAP
ncbi:hypothetical protein MVEN_00619100 [Mycena venus]|uniref:Uncharacterized protein n=1 Tax=Mycena venus TaxID=2733690 RepID=A0A8H7D8F3_9AGAR|nr:hypothetical protein MVEN_00619100 [Mycena venus]